MKIFITFSIFAMISAGAYGIVDMSRDVFQGTMINYRQAEQEMLANREIKTDSILPVVESGEFHSQHVTNNSSGEKMLTKIIRSYSRGEPETHIVKVKTNPKEDSIARVQQDRAVGESMIAMEPVKNIPGK